MVWSEIVNSRTRGYNWNLLLQGISSLEKSRFTRIGQLEFSLSHMCLWHIWGDISPLTSKKQDCPALSRAPKVRRSRSLDFAGQSCYCSPITLACKVISSFWSVGLTSTFLRTSKPGIYFFTSPKIAVHERVKSMYFAFFAALGSSCTVFIPE